MKNKFKTIYRHILYLFLYIPFLNFFPIIWRYNLTKLIAEWTFIKANKIDKIKQSINLTGFYSSFLRASFLFLVEFVQDSFRFPLAIHRRVSWRLRTVSRQQLPCRESNMSGIRGGLCRRGRGLSFGDTFPNARRSRHPHAFQMGKAPLLRR